MTKVDPTGEYGLVGAAYGAIAGGVGGYISGGWKGVVAGAFSGAIVGAVNPYSAHVVGAAAGAGVASLLGQGAGNWVAGKDVSNLCNYSFSAAAGAAFGGAIGGPLGSSIGKYIGPYRFQVINRPLGARSISRVPGNTIGAVAEGASVGTAEMMGMKIKYSIGEDK